MTNVLNNVLTSALKIKIVRFFTERTQDCRVTGREIARICEVSAPTAHTALKELYANNVLNYEVSGRNHLYSLNFKNRIVNEILLPVFQKEKSFQDDAFNYLITEVKKKKLSGKIISIIFYGSRQKKQERGDSDFDIAVIVTDQKDLNEMETMFVEQIAGSFNEFFGVALDVYIKTKNEFKKMLNNNLPPVSTLIKDYSMIYGEDPINWR